MASNWIKCAFIYAAVILAFIAPFGKLIRATGGNGDTENELMKMEMPTRSLCHMIESCPARGQEVGREKKVSDDSRGTKSTWDRES